MSSDQDRDNRIMIFLKSKQIDIFSLNFTIQCLQFNNTIIKILNIDDELIRHIHQTLLINLQIYSYLKHLIDNIKLRKDDIIEYFKFFSLHKNDLILHDELIYISDDDDIKLKILKSYHDSKTTEHLNQMKILEIIS